MAQLQRESILFVCTTCYQTAHARRTASLICGSCYRAMTPCVREGNCVDLDAIGGERDVAPFAWFVVDNTPSAQLGFPWV